MATHRNKITTFILVFSIGIIIFSLQFLLLDRYSQHLSESMTNSFKTENFEELSRGDFRSLIVKSNTLLEKQEIISLVFTFKDLKLINFNREISRFNFFE